jgi:hypothetical protein
MSRSVCTAIMLVVALCVAGCGGDKTIEPSDQPIDTTDNQPGDDQATDPVVEPAATQPANGDSTAVDSPNGDSPGIAGALGKSFLKAIAGGDDGEAPDDAPDFRR